MEFVIGSTSKRKIDVAEKILGEYFKDEKIFIEGYAAASGVPATPWDTQTFNGARIRASDAKIHVPDADYSIGLESGLVERYGHIYEETWCAVIAVDGKEFFGYSSGLKVPDYVLRRMDELQMEHSDVMMMLEEEHGKIHNDTWGNYSGGALIREISLEEAIRNTVIQIVASEDSFYRK